MEGLMIGMAAIQARRNASWRSLWVLMAIGALGACGSGEDEIVAPVPSVVFTLRDSSFNVGALRTFAMPDTVVQLAPVTGTALPVPREFDRTILDRVRADF